MGEASSDRMPVGLEAGLLEHDEWLRRLARRLVPDPQQAEDLAQDAVLIALKESEPPRSWRAWLGTVLRRLAHERHRRDQRRSAREQRSARPEDDEPSTLDLVEKVSAHREVVEVLMDLPEHYRAVLLHRYYGQQSPTEIARRIEAPLSTVKTRLDRGLKRMRDELDSRHGRSAWIALLTPWLEGGTGGSSGAGLEGASTERSGDASREAAGSGGFGGKGAAVAVVVVVGVALWWGRESGLGWRDGGERGAESSVGSSASAEGGAGLAGAVSPTLDAERREVSADVLGGADSRAPAVSAVVGLPEEVRPAVGSVLDAEGRPLAGVLLRFEPDLTHPFAEAPRDEGTVIALSQADGRYRFPALDRPGRVVASSPWVTVMAGKVGWRERTEAAVVVARRRLVRGTVRDADGLAVPRASLRFELPEGFGRGMPVPLDRSTACDWSVSGDADGAFEQSLPLGVPLELHLSSPGYETVRRSLDGTEEALALTLGSLAGSRLRGVVVDASGRGLAGAVVSDGRDSVRCGAGGAFVLLGAKGPRRLRAVARGWQTRVVEADDEEELRVVLDRPSRRLRGRVVDESGRAAEGMRVFLLDPQVLLDRPPSRAQDDETHWLLGARDRFVPPVAECVARGTPDTVWLETLTAEDGSFQLDGLHDRAYRVAVLDPATLVHQEFGPLPPDETSLLRFTRHRHRRIDGLVLDRDGRPVPGVRIELESTAMSLYHEGARLKTRLVGGPGTRSGPDGRFHFPRAPHDCLRLLLTHPDHLPQRRSDPGNTVVLHAERRCHLRAHLAPDHPATHLVVLDPQNQPLPLHRVRGDERYTAPRATLHEGLSDLLTVSDAGRTAVLYRGEEELERIGLRLRAGEVVTLR